MYKVTVPLFLAHEHFDKEGALAQVKRMGAERVALAGCQLTHSVGKDPEIKAYLTSLIDFYHQNGLEVLVWTGNTLGHGDSLGALSIDNSERNRQYHFIRHLNGNELSGVFCPKDEHLKKDLASVVRALAECGPDAIILDDDFRLNNREQGLGCCCDLHMAVIRDILGEDIDVPTLRQKMFTGRQNKYRDAWSKAQGDSLRDLALHLRAAVNEVNPAVRLGWCNSSDSWDYSGIDVIERSVALAGDTRPLVRTCGAPYWAANWRYHKRRFFLGEVVEFTRLQNSWMGDADIESISEGDTYPRPRTETPASYEECFDMMLRASGENDGILKFVLDCFGTPQYETGFVDHHVADRDKYATIERLFGDKKAVGYRPFVAAQTFPCRDIDLSDPDVEEKIQYDMYSPAMRFAVFNSLPTAYTPGGINICFGENGKHLPLEDLKYGSILDIEAARFLMERGVDVGIERIFELDDTVKNEYFPAEKEYAAVDGGLRVVKGYDANPGVRELSKFQLFAAANPADPRIGSPMVGGAFLYENADGQRFMVLPFEVDPVYDKTGWLDNYCRRRQLADYASWLNGTAPDVCVRGSHPQLYLMVKKNEKAMSVGLWNLYPDRIDRLRVQVATDSNEIEFVGCTGHREGREIVLDTPLYPYEFAAFEIQL